MSFRVLGAFGALLLMPATWAAEAQQVRAPVAAAKQPTGKWVVDFGAARCFLLREYGTRDKPLTVLLEPSAMGDQLRLIILESGQAEAMRGSAKITLEPGSKMIGGELLTEGLRKSGLVRRSIVLERVDFTPTQHTAILVAQMEGTPTKRFAIPKFADALKTLDACRVDLVARWGIPPALQARFKTRARHRGGDVRTVFDSNDYPVDAANQGTQGSVLTRIRIEPSGRVSACDVVSSSGSKSLDETTCRIILKRARYEPALDLDGKPMLSFDVTEVVFRMQ